jgi:hypothetical protein
LAYPFERPNSFVAIDHQVPLQLTGQSHHHDRHLLSLIGKGAQEPTFTIWLAHSQALVAQVKLVKLKLRHDQSPSCSPAFRGCSDHLLSLAQDLTGLYRLLLDVSLYPPYFHRFAAASGLARALRLVGPQP